MVPPDFSVHWERARSETTIKGVILAGGLGTRLMPLTKITNKHLLPIYNRPMIHWPLLTLINAGITDIMIVTGGSFAGDFLQLLGNGRDLGLRDLHYTYQEGEGGIADALSLAEDFVDRDRVVVILGDNIFEKSILPHVDAYRAQGTGAKILLREVPDPQRFGVPELDGDRVVGIEEKPRQPKSNFAVTGAYMYDEYVWEVIHGLEPSARGELEITDVNNAYVKRGDLTWAQVDGWWSDAGTFESLIQAGQLVRERESSEG
jgi:glucose-1-phosphate thymidylyltransferase